MNNRHFAIIALGSNLDNPVQQIRSALDALSSHPDIQLQKTSSLYTTVPVCAVSTDMDGISLLSVLNRIEADFGRNRSFRNAPRTLDLDIIDFDGIFSDDPHLTLPHPRAHERSFVMRPLAEILPDFVLGKHGKAAELSGKLGDQGIRLLTDK